jgi:rhamnosyltransferase
VKTKVAAYITCYQDCESANRCIQAIESQSIQIEYIYIVDNSENPLLLNNNSQLSSIHHYPNNIGIGEGLVKALAWAIDQGYNFLWTFDQDSIPTPSCLEILLETHDRLAQTANYKIGIIAPTPFDLRTKTVVTSTIFADDHFAGLKHNENTDCYECDAPITSGSLISLAAAQSISSPSQDLFIDGIDFDYGLRLRKKGFHNLVVPKAIMYHELGNPIQVNFLNKNRSIEQYPALRHYYICRNHTYLVIHFAKGYYRLTSLMRRIKHMLVSILWILLYDRDNKQLKIWACFLGTYHGAIGKLGKCW